MNLLGPQAREYDAARKTSHEAAKRRVREAVARFGHLTYGWDSKGTALPLRPDVAAASHRLFRVGTSPLDLAGLPDPAVSLNNVGSLAIRFTRGSRVVDLIIPCGGVLFARQYIGSDQNVFIDSRFDSEFDGLSAEWDQVRDWLADAEEEAT